MGLAGSNPLAPTIQVGAAYLSPLGAQAIDGVGLPHWLSDLSPFERVPQLPAASLTLLPLVVMSAVAAGLTLIGLTGLRRRDIGRI